MGVWIVGENRDVLFPGRWQRDRKDFPLRNQILKTAGGVWKKDVERRGKLTDGPFSKTETTFF